MTNPFTPRPVPSAQPNDAPKDATKNIAAEAHLAGVAGEISDKTHALLELVDEVPLVAPEGWDETLPGAMSATAMALTQLPENLQLECFGALALDLEMRGGADAHVLAQYGLTMQDIPGLELLPAMQQARVEARRAMQALNGEMDGFTLRTRLLTERMLAPLATRMQAPHIDPALQLRFFETLARYGRLDPGPKGAAAGGAQAGVSVVFNIGEGVRGISQPVVEVRS